IASPDFPHRSDHGLVRLGVADARTARAVFEELLVAATEAKPEARIEGVLVQEQVAGAVAEMIIGVSRDPVLGPAVLLGTGGVLAELLDDVAVCPLPLDRADVADMLDSLRGRALLSGWRGRPGADRKALLDAVMAVARLASACGEDLVELDLNPVVVRSSGVLCVDSLVVMA
ncbi:MAG TPA: acetate--CoA ligase family protein, partial [Acidimicrobiales bacterium]|nr:acetate--CoA ligase family protein [Acidimicrobiales bacterium]